MVIEIEKENGELWSLEIEKDYDENLGMSFDDLIFDRMKVCQNRCIFCFIDQLPPGMRKNLYIKDDDYRHSFIYGNFITLTNLTEQDWEKIEKMHLSPLYVSVHCTRPQLRSDMLANRRAGNIRNDLARLYSAGIEIHAQVVLCPGWNDGEIFRETVEELAAFHPSVQSVGIVPVGLTGHRVGLPHLDGVTPEQAAECIDMVETYQKLYREKLGTGFVYLADEFYLRAGQPLPRAKYYDDFCQVENGIGISRILLDEFADLEADLPRAVEAREVYLVTGKSAMPVLEILTQRLNQIPGMSIQLLPVANQHFGGGVSVTGLLTGKDIMRAMDQAYQGKKVLIPNVVFREGQDVLLDDISLEKLQALSQANIELVDGSAADLIRVALGTK